MQSFQRMQQDAYYSVWRTIALASATGTWQLGGDMVRPSLRLPGGCAAAARRCGAGGRARACAQRTSPPFLDGPTAGRAALAGRSPAAPQEMEKFKSMLKRGLSISEEQHSVLLGKLEHDASIRQVKCAPTAAASLPPPLAGDGPHAWPAGGAGPARRLPRPQLRSREP